MKNFIIYIVMLILIPSLSFATTLGLTVDSGKIWVYSVNESDGSTTLLNSTAINGGGWQSAGTFVDDANGKIYIKGGAGSWEVYNYITNSWDTDVPAVSGTEANSSLIMYQVPWNVDSNGNAIITSGTDSEDSSTTTILGSLDISNSSGTTLIEQDTNGNTIKIGEDSSGETGLIISNTTDAIDIQDGAGNTMIKVTSDGATHIGENSLVTQEVNGRQELYATNSDGNQIDINIKSGTNLLIDGVNILDSIGADISGSSAMSAALAALPNASPDAAYTCGLGTGLHDSSSALAAGCAADFANFAFVDNMPSIFKRASFNIGSSFLMNGEPDLSEARDTSIKAGITFKFGAPKKIKTTEAIQFRTENKIDVVMLQNKKVMNENALLKDQIAAINLKLETLNMVTSN